MFNWRKFVVSLFLIITMLFISQPLFAQSEDINPYARETKDQKDARMKWWREARFGLFIHWGVYSVPAGIYKGEKIPRIGEWIMLNAKIPVAEYAQFAKQFHPVKYDPDGWVKLAKEAGMKYVVITSKHHDGFALFDSKVTDWDVVNATPYGKDLLKPLAEACRKYGLKLGFYYSQAQDWHHQGGAAAREGHWDTAQDGSMDEYIKNIAVPQVREILTNYGDLAILWWDTPVNMNQERADMLLPLIKLQPGIITNNRLYRDGPEYAGDTDTPEQHIPATGIAGRDWEVCMTMNDTWGYKSYDDNWKSTEMLLHNLIDISSKGGNYLLNVGPTSEGLIPQPSIDRLKEIGKWMAVNNEAIYATTASPFYHLSWGRCTKKIQKDGTTLYLHVFDWPENGKLVVPGLRSPVSAARLHATGKVLKTSRSGDDVVVELPSKAVDQIASVVILEIKGDLNVQSNMPGQAKDGSIFLHADLAKIHNRGYADQAILKGKGKEATISNWKDNRTRVSWMFKTETTGRYKVVADIAAANNNQCSVKVDDLTIKSDLKATGGMSTYVSVVVGEVDLNKIGEHLLEISPVGDNWQGIQLRGIQLIHLK